jgi:hypothetical protein
VTTASAAAPAPAVIAEAPAAAPQTVTGELAFTGAADTDLLVLLGGALIAIGALLTQATRRALT